MSIDDKKQIGTWLPIQLIKRLDNYLTQRHKQTGQLNDRVEFITEAITEKLDKEEEATCQE